MERKQVVEPVERVESPTEVIYLVGKEQQQDTVEQVQEALATMVEGVVLVQGAVVFPVVVEEVVLPLYHQMVARKMVVALHPEGAPIQTTLEAQLDMEPILLETVHNLGMMVEMDMY